MEIFEKLTPYGLKNIRIIFPGKYTVSLDCTLSSRRPEKNCGCLFLCILWANNANFAVVNSKYFAGFFWDLPRFLGSINSSIFDNKIQGSLEYNFGILFWEVPAKIRTVQFLHF